MADTEQWRADLAARVAEERRQAALGDEQPAAPKPANPIKSAYSTSVILLGIVALPALLSGLGAMVFGTSAIHQILTACYFLIFVVCVAGIGIIRAVRGQSD